MSQNPLHLHENIRPILGAIRSVPIPPHPEANKPNRPDPEPFVTISREPGAGAWTLARKLTERMNQVDEAGRPWTCWDRQLVREVADDQQLHEELIESLEDANHSWMMDMLRSLAFSDSVEHSDEARIYGRMAGAIRALAQAGRVIIVGAGGAFITRHMPGGIHVRLVAPREHRIQFVASQLGLAAKDAAAYVAEREHNHQVFYRRYWSKETLSPHNFTMTLNTAAMEMDRVVETIVAATPHRAHAY